MFELGFQRSELRFSDQGARKDVSIDVGDALVAGRMAAVANKQAKNRITSRVVGRDRRSSKESEERLLFIQNSLFYTCKCNCCKTK